MLSGQIRVGCQGTVTVRAMAGRADLICDLLAFRSITKTVATRLCLMTAYGSQKFGTRSVTSFFHTYFYLGI